MPLLTIIPYHDESRAAAIRLANFLPKPSCQSHLWMLARYDCRGITPSEIGTAEHKHTRTYYSKSMSVGTGHPGGPNAMSFDLFGACNYRRHREWKDVDCLLLMEPDCVVISRTWADDLLNEWKSAKLANPEVIVVGCHRSAGVDVPHVNGNALWAMDTAQRVQLCPTYDNPPGWDSALASQIGSRYQSTPLINNLWRETNVKRDRMLKNPFSDDPRTPVMIHGCPDDAWGLAFENCA